MFTASCFIRKNTPELINKLVGLGYVKALFDEEYTKRDTYGLIVDQGDIVPLEHAMQEMELMFTYNFIDCTDNENLFLSIAALRDDSDKEQWFITYKSSHPYMSYAAILCREDKWEDEYIKETQQHCFINTKPEDYHKANVKEIIRIHKEIDEDLKDLYEY